VPYPTKILDLADFLISRAVKNPILSNRFHWYLMVEVADQVMAKMYGRVIYKFQHRIGEVCVVPRLKYRVTDGISPSLREGRNDES
jgi:hypothetical protein